MPDPSGNPLLRLETFTCLSSMLVEIQMLLINSSKLKDLDGFDHEAFTKHLEGVRSVVEAASEKARTRKSWKK
jgi:hypothetical protein